MTDILTTTPAAAADAAQESRSQQEHTRLLPLIRAVPDHEILQITVDVRFVVTTALGCRAELINLRPRVQAELPKYDIARYDCVEPLALALGYAHTLYMRTHLPVGEMPELVQLATQGRDLMMSDLRAAAKRGLVDEKPIVDLKRPLSHRGTAFDLLALCGYARENWARLAGKTPITMDELSKYEQAAERLLYAVGERDQAPASPSEASEDRQRAFTLFVKTWDYVRRAVWYLRWEEADADLIAPSLYAGRSGGVRKKAEGETGGVTPPESESAPKPPAPAPASSVLSSVQPSGIPVGFPGSDPFVRG